MKVASVGLRSAQSNGLFTVCRDRLGLGNRLFARRPRYMRLRLSQYCGDDIACALYLLNYLCPDLQDGICAALQMRDLERIV